MTIVFKFVIIEFMQQKSLGKFILEQRKALMPKKSLNSFALDIGIEPATLSRIENLKQDIKFITLEKISGGFNLKTSDFISRYEEWQNN